MTIGLTRDDERSTTYGSTNRWFRLAIALWDSYRFLKTVTQDKLSTELDHLLPRELPALHYEPATPLMRKWRAVFFDYQDYDSEQSSGLIMSDKGSEIRKYAVVDPWRTHHLKMLDRMTDFLEWFPDDDDFTTRCSYWADAVMEPQPPQGKKGGGHRASSTSWFLHDHIRADKQDWGVPHAMTTKVVNYGTLAEAFETLANTVAQRAGQLPATPRRRGDSQWLDAITTYQRFARMLNSQLWHSRLNRTTYLMPDEVTTRGPLPGDRIRSTAQNRRERAWVLDPPPEGRQYSGYTHDTDALYWARKMYSAYWLAGGETRKDLRLPYSAPLEGRLPPPDDSWTATERERALAPRRRRVTLALERLLAGDNGPSAPHESWYVLMALALTLDWIRGGWDDVGGHFVRKVYLEGDAATTALYGDGMWNTLYVLVEAYRVTGDLFYLDVLARAWDKFEQTSHSDSVPEERKGLFHELRQGSVPDRPKAEKQELFIDVMVSAFEATVFWRRPRPDLLGRATRLAARAEERFTIEDTERGDLVAKGPANVLHKPLDAGAVMLRLAVAEGEVTGKRLVRVAFSKSDRLASVPMEIQFESVDDRSKTVRIDVRTRHAVVYMNEGRYRIAGFGIPGGGLIPGTERSISVTGDVPSERAEVLG